MKKVLTTIILSGIFFVAFAQQSFKPIHYFTGGGGGGMLDYGVFNISKPRALTGVININMADSTISITDKGTDIGKFKIATVMAEVTDQNGGRSLTIVVSNIKYGFAATATIVRDQANAAKKEMKFILKYRDSASATTYDCALLENLFEN